MQITIRNLAAAELGNMELNEAVFGVDVRPDILQRVVLWQLAKRRAGTQKGPPSRRAPSPGGRQAD